MKPDSKTTIYAQVAWQQNAIDLHIGIRDRHEAFFSAQPVDFTATEERAFTPPMLRLPRGDAQTLMDQLWSCGIRPTEGAGSAGAMAATERHLKDMQKIAFGLLRDDGVQA